MRIRYSEASILSGSCFLTQWFKISVGLILSVFINFSHADIAYISESLALPSDMSFDNDEAKFWINDVNNQGQVIGHYAESVGPGVGPSFYWKTPSDVRVLNEVVSTSGEIHRFSGIQLHAINDSGYIVGAAYPDDCDVDCGKLKGVEFLENQLIGVYDLGHPGEDVLFKELNNSNRVLGSLGSGSTEQVILKQIGQQDVDEAFLGREVLGLSGVGVASGVSGSDASWLYVNGEVVDLGNIFLHKFDSTGNGFGWESRNGVGSCVLYDVLNETVEFLPDIFPYECTIGSSAYSESGLVVYANQDLQNKVLLDTVTGMSYSLNDLILNGSIRHARAMNDRGDIAGIDEDGLPVILHRIDTGDLVADMDIKLVAGANSGNWSEGVFNYKSEITNKGPTVATGIVVVNEFHGSLEVASISAGNAECLSTPGRLTCNIDYMNINEVREIDIVLATSQSNLDFPIDATVSVAHDDPVSENNSAAGVFGCGCSSCPQASTTNATNIDPVWSAFSLFALGGLMRRKFKAA